MPLKPGKSRKALGENIRELRKTGRKPKQAIGIAFSVRDRPKKGKSRLKAKEEGTWKGWSDEQKAWRKKKFGTDSPTPEQRSLARANARNQGTAGMVGKPKGSEGEAIRKATKVKALLRRQRERS